MSHLELKKWKLLVWLRTVPWVNQEFQKNTKLFAYFLIRTNKLHLTEHLLYAWEWQSKDDFDLSKTWEGEANGKREEEIQGLTSPSSCSWGSWCRQMTKGSLNEDLMLATSQEQKKTDRKLSYSRASLLPKEKCNFERRQCQDQHAGRAVLSWETWRELQIALGSLFPALCSNSWIQGMRVKPGVRRKEPGGRALASKSVFPPLSKLNYKNTFRNIKIGTKKRWPLGFIAGAV